MLADTPDTRYYQDTNMLADTPDTRYYQDTNMLADTPDTMRRSKEYLRETS